MAHVARRQLENRLDRFVLQTHRVVALDAGPEAVQNPAGFFDRRLRDVDAAEPPGQRLVLQEVFLVFGERRGGNHPDFAAREHRLEDVRRVRRRAERRTGADDRVRLVHEDDEMRLLLQFPDDVLQPVLEHPSQHRPGDEGVHLEVDDLTVAQARRHGGGFELDAPRQSFSDGGLADAGLADEHHRVGPVAVAEDFEHLLDFLLASEHGRQAVLLGKHVQVRGKLFQVSGKLEALLQALVAHLDFARPLVQVKHDVRRIGAVAREDRCRRARRRLFEHRRDDIHGLEGLFSGTAWRGSGRA